MLSCHSSFRGPHPKKKESAQLLTADLFLQFLASCYHVIPASAALILRKKKPDNFSQQISFAIPCFMLSCHSSFRGPHPKEKETAQLLTADLFCNYLLHVIMSFQLPAIILRKRNRTASHSKSLLQFLAACYHVIPPSAALILRKRIRTASHSRSLLQFLASCYHVIPASAALILRKKKPHSFLQQISFCNSLPHVIMSFQLPRPSS